MQKPAYRDTAVTIDKSRSQIAAMLMSQWKASKLGWEDDYESGTSTLRFQWKPAGSDAPVVVRLELKPDPTRVRSRAQAEREKLREKESKRLHRVTFWWLKAMVEAIEAGLLQREEVLLPWVEAPNGQTIAQAMLPRLVEFGSGKLALGKGRDA